MYTRTAEDPNKIKNPSQSIVITAGFCKYASGPGGSGAVVVVSAILIQFWRSRSRGHATESMSDPDSPFFFGCNNYGHGDSGPIFFRVARPAGARPGLVSCDEHGRAGTRSR